MLTAAAPIVFLATTNAENARDFYENLIGLTFLEESDFAIVFSSGDVELRIQKVANFDPQPFTTLGWEVSSIDNVVKRLTDKGFTFKKFNTMDQSELGIWKSPSGAKIAWFNDPDGNLLSITQK